MSHSIDSESLLANLGDLSPERRALLAQAVLRLRKQDGESSRKLTITPTPLRAESNAFPLSFAEERLWFLDQLMPGSALYNRPIAVRLQGYLNVAALTETFNAIVQRHEILRTSFHAEDGRPRQVVTAEVRLTLPVIDIRDLPASKREAEALRLSTEEAWKPFDLSQGPLIRVTLVRQDEEDYLLLVTLHHIISDGWSLGIIIKEVGAFYEAFVSGKTASLAPLAIQYADFAVWQRQWLSGQVLEDQLAYWKQQLGDQLPVLALPTDRPRPPLQSFRGGTIDFILPAPLLGALTDLSQRENSTLFMVLLSAFALLLHRYSGQDDILIATPVAGRNHSEVESLIGLFINNLVLRADLSGEPSFRELLARLRQVTLEAYDHSVLPFEKLVEELQPERHLDRQPLYQVMFALQNAPMQKMSRRELTLTPVRNQTRSETSDDLNLSVIEIDSGLRGIMEYNSEIFDSSTVRRMIANFHTLLESIVAAPEESISRLGMLSTAERQQVVVDWNATAHEYPRALCVSNLFEMQVNRTPDGPALVFEDVELSYRELNERANQLAHYLRTLNVGPDTIVGICAERSIEMVVGMLGILKAGGAYLPLDPQYPPERIKFMLADAQVGLLLTQQRLLASLPSHAARVICLDTVEEIIGGESRENPVSVTWPENLAYVIYTSGSTGKPKGVQMTHRPLVNLITWQCQDLRGNETARTLQFASLSFDMSFQEMLTTWASGGCMVLIAEEARRDGPALLSVLQRYQVTRLLLPFVGLQQLAEAVQEGAEPPEHLRDVISAGEQLRITPAIKLLFERLEECRLYNQYGPSEVHAVTSVQLPERVDQWSSLPPIGSPIWNAQIYVLDRHLYPVPTGVAGEIYIGGDCVSRGFLRRPDLTAERYLPDPYGPIGGARLYRSGDVGRRLADGQIEILGRDDQQVKIRGYRIELGEVETVLDRHELVGKSVVIAREDVPGEKRLVGYVVPPPGQPAPTTSALRRYMQENLPPYMVPTVFVILDELPLTPSGKINRRALPIPDTTRPTLDEAQIAPRTPVEKTLAHIWATVLNLENVGINDNFLDLGGDSILSIQIISRAKRAGLQLTLTQLWEQLTIANLASVAIVSEPQVQENWSDNREADRRQTSEPAGQIQDTYPLSSMQQGILFHSVLEKSAGEYVEQFSCLLNGELDVPAFRRAWEHVIERHPALRTTFLWEDLDAPVQLVHSEFNLSLEQYDWRTLAAEQQDTRFAAFITAEQQEGCFDLGAAPLMRLYLFHLAEGIYRFVWSFHDIVIDGWSAPLILDEVRVCYEAFRRAQDPQLPRSYPYRSFIDWLQVQDLSRAETFWRRTLKGFTSATRLPFDRELESETFNESGYKQQRVNLSPSATAALQAFARKHQLTLNTLMQGAWALLLGRFSSQDEVLFGSVVSGRPADLVGIESTVGVFVNTLPVRVRIAPEAPLVSWLKELQATQLEARQYESSPLIQIQKWSEVPAAQRLFESILAFVNYPASSEGFWHDSEWHLQKSGYPIFVVVRPGAELLLEITYTRQLFDDDTISRLLSYFQAVLEAMSVDAEQHLLQLPLLPESDRRLMTSLCTGTVTDFQPDACFSQQFEKQVQKTPETVGVIFLNQQMTYAEINSRANRMARSLVQRGVGPETIVGILSERNAEFLIAVLAVFKAGGAYLPLDPAYAPHRLAQILEQSKPAAILTTAGLLSLLEDASRDLPSARNLQILQLDQLAQEKQDNADLKTRSAPEHLAYVIYTSGSTGVPKGALVEHRGMLNHLYAKVGELNLGSSDIVAQTASQCFDISIWQMLAVLLVGGCVHIFDDEVAHNPARLLKQVDAEGVTILETVPSLMRLMLDEVGGESPVPAFGSLRWLIPTGEALPPALCRDWLSYYPNIPLLNAYGPTECSDDVSHYRIIQPPSEDALTIPIGSPVANMRLYVLDSRWQPVPIKVAGELYVGGVGVGRGYLNDAINTAAAFIPDSFGDKGARLYRTGDHARFLPDGNLEFLGRVDSQVKIRGFRIELGEIEALLRQHAQVRECVVLAPENSAGDKQLIAWVVGGVSGDTLRDYLKERLPYYMLPAYFVMLDHLPLTENGKVDRHALHAPDDALAEQADEFVMPTGPVEETLAKIWMELLGLERVGVHDDFFKLGGHSLLATMVFARIRTAFHVELPLRLLFNTRTIAELAVLVEEALLAEIEALGEEHI